MPVRSSHFCSLILGAIPALFAVQPALADNGTAGYEGWAFSTPSASLARDPLADYRRARPVGAGTGYADSPTGLQLSHTLANGMALDAGMSRGREWMTDAATLTLVDRDYRDTFLGFRYNGFSGKVWYLDQPRGEDSERSLYYQAGWKAPVSDRLSVSLQMGQTYRHGVGFDQEYPDLSIAAEGSFNGYGLGIRLVDRNGLGLAGDEDQGYSLMGSFSKRFP